MASATRPTRHVDLSAGTDVTGVLDRGAIEYVEVNERRLVAIARRAIFVVEVEAGTLTDANELTVQLWAPPPVGAATDPRDVLLEEFVESLAPLDATG